MYTVHEPVMLKEVVQYLNPSKNQNFIDCTVGAGGHAQAILEKTAPKGKLLGLDWDLQAINNSAQKLSKYSSRTILINANYIKIKEIVYENRFYPVHGILLDLGLSLDQLQSSGRGFSFQQDEPLDMRFSLDNELTAEKILNTYRQDELERIFREYGEEKSAKKIAAVVAKTRKQEPIKTTLQLVDLIIKNKRLDRRRRIHPATKIFQALRIEVNNELNNINLALKDCLDILDQKGRLAVISFHSLEDRLVKHYFRQEAKNCICPPEVMQCQCSHQARIKLVTKKPVAPTAEEVAKNFRARSAKLRVVEKI